LTLITQNVDDLHEAGGSSDVIHLHGNIAANKCFFDCQGAPTHVDISTLEYHEGPPPCPHCGRWVRPAVVWFGEALPTDAINAAFVACNTADVMLVVGTSGLVSPAALLPSTARNSGATIIEINPEATPITPLAAVTLRGPAGQMLPRVLEALDA
jgi:NAD-dependent deacetylase